MRKLTVENLHNETNENYLKVIDYIKGNASNGYYSCQYKFPENITDEELLYVKKQLINRGYKLESVKNIISDDRVSGVTIGMYSPREYIISWR